MLKYYWRKFFLGTTHYILSHTQIKIFRYFKVAMVTIPLFVSYFFRIHHICQHGDCDARALPPTVDVRHYGCSQVATRYVTVAYPGDRQKRLHGPPANGRNVLEGCGFNDRDKRNVKKYKKLESKWRHAPDDYYEETLSIWSIFQQINTWKWKDIDMAGGDTSPNKKVLLRERKRHTDHGVSSTTRGEVLPLSGYPPARSDRGEGTWGGLSPGRGYPPARSNGGYLRWGTPGKGVSPWQKVPPGRGTPPGWTWLGYPPLPGPGRGTPLGVDRQTDTCQNITFPSYYVRGR